VTTAAVILDVDGTLVDSNDAHARAWVGAFAAEGITVAFDRVRRAIGMGGDKLMPDLSGIERDSERGRLIEQHRSRIFKTQELPHIKSFASVRLLAHRLIGDRFVLVVGSSAKEDELQPLLERAGIADLVSARASSDDVEDSKPDPDIVLAALDAAGSDPSNAIMLGDTPYDVAAARRAGVRIVGVESGGWTRDDLAGSVAVYADAADLLTHYDASPFATARASSPAGR
jgi:phosphoglycolate phosphatase-like HAD superfamily hydrolase